ncbi:MAG: hypothetical protein Q8912_12695 [Bacillota bacterium]|nr:hypothetical protein [Bacillota bacterium]MDP4159175.1 hypothetical protein [Bacillota bacterium]
MEQVWKRILPLAAGISFALAMTLKLWGMILVSNFYYQGLHLDIYASKVTGDLDELNILNHYIGMMNINSSLPEFKWIPYVFGIILVLCLMMAILPSIKVLISGTLLVLIGLGIMGGDFYYRLYQYGHNFDPTAAIKVPGFTPKIIGHYQLANFDVTTNLGLGGYMIILGVILLFAAIYNTVRLSRKTRSRVS